MLNAPKASIQLFYYQLYGTMCQRSKIICQWNNGEYLRHLLNSTDGHSISTALTITKLSKLIGLVLICGILYQWWVIISLWCLYSCFTSVQHCLRFVYVLGLRGHSVLVITATLCICVRRVKFRNLPSLPTNGSYSIFFKLSAFNFQLSLIFHHIIDRCVAHTQDYFAEQLSSPVSLAFSLNTTLIGAGSLDLDP